MEDFILPLDLVFCSPIIRLLVPFVEHSEIFFRYCYHRMRGFFRSPVPTPHAASGFFPPGLLRKSYFPGFSPE